MRYLLALALGTLVVGDPRVPSRAVTLPPLPVNLGNSLVSKLGTSGIAPLPATPVPVSIPAPLAPPGTSRQKGAPQVLVPGLAILASGAPIPSTPSAAPDTTLIPSAVPTSAPAPAPAPTPAPSPPRAGRPPAGPPPPSGVIISIALSPGGASIPIFAGPSGPTPASIIVGPGGRPIITGPAGPTPVARIIGPNGPIRILASAGSARPTRPPPTPAPGVPSPLPSAPVPPAALNSSNTIPRPSAPPTVTSLPGANYYTSESTSIKTAGSLMVTACAVIAALVN